MEYRKQVVDDEPIISKKLLLKRKKLEISSNNKLLSDLYNIITMYRYNSFIINLLINDLFRDNDNDEINFYINYIYDISLMIVRKQRVKFIWTFCLDSNHQKYFDLYNIDKRIQSMFKDDRFCEYMRIIDLIQFIDSSEDNPVVKYRQLIV